MDFKTKKIDDASVQIIVNATAAEVEEAYQEAFRRAGAQIKMPGFRKGKAPAELIERHLGDAVANDAARALIADTFQKIVHKLDPSPISLPQFEIETFGRGKGATFKGVYDVWPEVKLGKYKKLKVTEDVPVVADADIDEEVERLRSSHAMLKSREAEPVESGDQVTVSLKIDESGTVLFENKEYRFWAGKDEPFPGMNDAVIGMRSGESKTYEREMAADFEDEKFAGKKVNVLIEVASVVFPELPELNDDFARDVSKHDTLAALRSEIQKTLLDSAVEHIRSHTAVELVDRIVADSKVSVPESMVKSEFDHRISQIHSRIGKELPVAEIAAIAGKEPAVFENELKGSAEKAARDRLILLEITRKENLQVDEGDIENEIRSRYAPLVKADQVQALLQNEELREDVKSRILYRKTLDWICEHAEVKKGSEIPLKKFKEAHQH